MTDHYYSHKPTAESNPRVWSYNLRGHMYKFKTDHGVFSKGEVDFGSRLLIETFTKPEVNGPIIDIGCGYGPIGLSIAKLLDDRIVHMVDVNERALDLAKENAKLNHITNIHIYESSSFGQVTETAFSAVVTNPPIRAGKKVVFDILEKGYAHLSVGGDIWVVIQKKQGAPSAKKKLEELFGNVETVKRDKGYYIFKAKKALTI